MALLDLRPTLLQLKVFPGQSYSINFHFPEGRLTGDWEARLGDDPIDTVIDGDDLTINFDAPVETGTYSFELWTLEDPDPDSIKILGRIRVSRSSATPVESTEITIGFNEATINLEVLGFGPTGPGVPGDAAASIIYVGNSTNLISDPDEPRPDTPGPVYWMMYNGVSPNNGIDGDIVFNSDRAYNPPLLDWVASRDGVPTVPPFGNPFGSSVPEAWIVDGERLVADDPVAVLAYTTDEWLDEDWEVAITLDFWPDDSVYSTHSFTLIAGREVSSTETSLSQAQLILSPEENLYGLRGYGEDGVELRSVSHPYGLTAATVKVGYRHNLDEWYIIGPGLEEVLANTAQILPSIDFEGSPMVGMVFGAEVVEGASIRSLVLRTL